MRTTHAVLMRLMVPTRIRLLDELRGQIGWTEDQVRKHQEEQLRKLISYCWENVPYYRSRWASHVSGPQDVQTLDDLQRLPLLTKEELRDELDDLTTRVEKDRGEEARSGGSTGRPTRYRMTRFDQEVSWAQLYLGWSWAGYRVGAPFLIVGGESVGVGLGDRRTWKDWVINRRVTSGSNLTIDRVQALARSPHFDRLEFIYGYPNAIREFGELLADIGRKPPRLRGVMCTAEVMRDEVRNRISECLGGVPVLDQYGMNDGGILAIEGPERDGHHVFFYRAILEVLDDQNRQITALRQPGRAVATSLTNFATPFVRYTTGDEVHWYTREPAASGIAWPRLGPIDGRTGDVIYLPSGRRIAMPGLTLVMRWIEDLHAYQFIQTGPSEVTVRLQRGPGFTWDEEQARKYLSEKITDEIRWTIDWGAPELSMNGKLLLIRNDWLRAQGLTRPPRP